MAIKYTLSTGSVLQENLKELLENIDVFWFRLGYKIDQEVLSVKTRCKVLATPVTGIDHIDEKICKQHAIKIICLRGEQEFLKEVRATAEHTIFLTLALMRKCYAAIRDVTKGNWNRDAYRGYEVYKKRVGIIGMGRLGTIVAGYFSALGCSIYYYDILDVNVAEEYIKVNSTEELIEKTDIISLHIPYNVENHTIYDARFFSTFNDDKWLINTSRGGIIDESALLIALKEQKIAGYATDVLHGEPDINNHELIKYARTHENVLITPHIGGNTFESFEKTEKFIAEKVNSWIAKNYSEI